MCIHALFAFYGLPVCEEMASGVLGYKIKTNPVDKIGFVVLWIMEMAGSVQATICSRGE